MPPSTKASAEIASLEWVCRRSKPQVRQVPKESLRLVDLFCGCGGLTLGVWEAARRKKRQLKVRLAVDSNLQPLQVFRSNFDTEAAATSIEDVAALFPGGRGRRATQIELHTKQRLGRVDILVSGPPCQGHSDLNNSTRRNDPRNSLYLRVVRAAEVLQPRVVLIENVPTVQLDQQEVVAKSISWLAAAGYTMLQGVVKLSHLGLAQTRRRHVLVGIRHTNSLSLSDLLSPFPKEAAASAYLEGLEDEPLHYSQPFYQPARVTVQNQKRIDYLFDNDLFELPDRERPPCHRDKKHAYVSMYGRMHWDKPAQTLTSGFGSMGQGRYVHPKRRRLITPHEAARLQGFPDFFDFSTVRSITALRTMIANAVPPQFSATITNRLIELGYL
jgi:DNA (cytosine-5)-methyltransferase 1